MLYKVDVHNPQGDLLSLTLDDITDGLIVQDIGGLDPVKASVVSTQFGQQDGAEYQSARRDPRNVTMKIAMDPSDDTPVSELRARLYNFFMSKAEVFLRFYTTEGLQVDTSGRVESMEAPLFAQDPEANISIICFDPDFVDVDDQIVTGLSTSDITPTNVVYDGTTNTGMVITLNVHHILNEVTIYQGTPSGDLYSMDFSAPLVGGDILTISTVKGDKYVTLTRAGVVTSVLYGLAPQSKWLELEKGNNTIRVYATDGGSPASVSFMNRYGGL
jgi:hypothetical protein